MTIYAIVGTRTFNNYEKLCNTIGHIQDMTHIVSGGAYGTDALAEQYARDKNIPITVIKPQWNIYGKSAGPIRNRQIVECSDVIIAFWDYASKGTKSTIDICKELGKTYYIINIHE